MVRAKSFHRARRARESGSRSGPGRPTRESHAGRGTTIWATIRSRHALDGFGVKAIEQTWAPVVNGYRLIQWKRTCLHAAEREQPSQDSHRPETGFESAKPTSGPRTRHIRGSDR